MEDRRLDMDALNARQAVLIGAQANRDPQRIRPGLQPLIGRQEP